MSNCANKGEFGRLSDGRFHVPIALGQRCCKDCRKWTMPTGTEKYQRHGPFGVRLIDCLGGVDGLVIQADSLNDHACGL